MLTKWQEYVPLLGGGMGVHSWVEIDRSGDEHMFLI